MSEQTEPSRKPGRHPVSIGHLVMGLALLGLAGVWALVASDVVTGDDVRWLLPIPWVAAGAVGLAVTAVAGGRRHAVRQTGWAGSGSAGGATSVSTGSGFPEQDPPGDPAEDRTSTQEPR